MEKRKEQLSPGQQLFWTTGPIRTLSPSLSLWVGRSVSPAGCATVWGRHSGFQEGNVPCVPAGSLVPSTRWAQSGPSSKSVETIISSSAQITSLGPPNRQHGSLPSTQNRPSTKKTRLTKSNHSARGCGFDLKLHEGPEYHGLWRKTLPHKYPHFGAQLAQCPGISSKKKNFFF